jgi:hypothetical protein
MRMRTILTILASIAFLSPKAQNYSPVGQLDFMQGRPLPGYTPFVDNTPFDQKWHFTKYAGLSAGTTFFSGGSAFFPAGISFLSTPVGLQLSHPLNKNLYAFAGISATPVFFSFNRLYTDPSKNPSYPGYNFSKPYGLGLNSRVEMGLMYINDAKTFSISGSVGIDRNSYPVYQANRVNPKKQ